MDLSAVSSVLKTIGELLTQEVTSLLGQKDQVEDLQRELIWMQSYLKEADARKVDNEVVPGDGEGSSSSNERLDSRRPYPHIIEDNIVGLDDDIKNLVSVLVDEESHFRVVSICGMGGLGKTTLAKKIYRHGKVIGHFNHLAWVYVSQQFQKRKVWEDILSGLKFLVEEDRKKRVEELAEKLSKFLEENKCLVILDDIWSIKAWDSLKPGFPAGDTRSKILLTSRNKEVVSHADRGGYLYELQCLKDEQSWEVLQKISFPERDSTGIVSSKQEEGNGGEIIEHVAKRYLIELVQSSKLPSSLGNLRCLQTLDLRVEGDSIHVPNVIWRMEQLRHLYLPERCKRKTKLKLDTLRNLQTLLNFSTRSCYVEDLLNMTNLSKLMIVLPFNIKDFKEDLEKNSPILASKYLRFLSINICPFDCEVDPRHFAHLVSSCVNICELSLWVKIVKLPEYHHFSSSIAYIQLEWSHHEEDPMPTLGKLRNLRIVELYIYAFTGKEMVCSAQSFPKLDSLSLDHLSELEEWKVDEGAMPALRHLRIGRCLELKKLPDGLRFITALQELKIELMPKAFKDKLVEGGEDFYKVQHVPSIIIQNRDHENIYFLN
ncbi:hypothetical protein CRYUN_Cryun11dG0038900 [Craigia yunnanensis]